MIQISRNPPLDAALVDAVVALWVEVTNAGGAVGFLPGVTDADVRPTALAALDRVAAGADDLVLATLGERPVGLGFLQTSAHRLAAHVGTVKSLMRAPSLRGTAVGAAVLRGLEEAAADRGLSLLTLAVRGGTGREAFYAVHGYRVDGRLPARMRVADDSLVEVVQMSKPLAAEALAPTATLEVRRLDPDLPLPAYAHPGDAGLDLRAAEPAELAPGQRASVPTGLAVAIPLGCVGLVHPRSGLAARSGLTVVNAPGTIDAGYRGELRVLLINLDPTHAVRIDRGDRIAQLLVQRVEHVRILEVPTLPDTPRGTGGFGSTGR